MLELLQGATAPNGKCRWIVKLTDALGPLCIIAVTLALPCCDYGFVLIQYLSSSNSYPPGFQGLAIVHFIIVTPLAFMIVLSVLCAWLCDPGYTETFLSRYRDRFHSVTSEFLSSLPQCVHCNLPKPLRAHHCSECGKCVLKMDHHCPAVGTCVGLRNFRSFLAMLLWSTIGCTVMTLFCIAEGIADTVMPDVQVLSFVFGGASGFMTILVGLFFGDQFRRARINQTTIEAIGRGPPRYDLGRHENLRQVFGDSKFGLLWPFPNDLLSGFEWSLPEYQNASALQENQGIL